jgi:hypothetical protein
MTDQDRPSSAAVPTPASSTDRVSAQQPQPGARGAAAPAPRRGNQRADRVLLLAADLHPLRQAYVDGHLKGVAEVHEVKSFGDMVEALGRFAVISELTILGHSGPNTFLFKQPGGGFRGTTLTQAAASFQSQAAVPRPQVATIHLQSCNAGLDPAPLVEFAKVFDAGTIVAWNQFYVAVVKRVTVPPDATGDQLRAKLIDEARYLPADVRPEDLAGRPGTHLLLVEWFRVDESNENLPPAAKKAGDENPARKPFKRVASAEERRIQSRKELEDLASELRLFEFQDPAKPLLKIVIETAGLTPTEGKQDQ